MSHFAIRWSDNDRYFGPFTYARETWRHFAIVLGSGDGDEYPGCRLRVSAFGRTLILALPQIIRPWRRKVTAQFWDKDTIARLGQDWYYETHEREYGLSYSEGHLVIRYGRQTHDSSTEQSWGTFLPWTQWRHVRHSLFGRSGELVVENTNGMDWERRHAAEESCPCREFRFEDFDREQLTARTRVEEREWRFGEGSFKWMSLFRRAKISRSLDIQFSGETGRRKGSWKGGTVGHSIEMQPGELHERAFRRYCDEHEMTFLGVVREMTGK